MAEDLTHRHIQRVLSVIQQGRNEIFLEDSILRSWKRCLEGYTIEPAERHQTRVIEHPRLVEHYQRMESLLQIAGTEIGNLYRQISHSGYVILLTDRDGVILHSLSDPVLRDDFMRAGLWRGAIWSEDQEGTNAIGTCLIERLPLTVHLDEHYRVNNIKLTCSAAPIFDPYGDLLAILDVSSVNSRDSKRSQAHTLALAGMSARLIENRYFLRQFSQHWVLRFSPQPEFVDLLGEGMIALGEDGAILAANRGALDHLGLGDLARLRRQPLSTVFAVDPDALLGRAQHEQSNAVRPLLDRHGKQYYVTLRAPERPVTPPRPADGNPAARPSPAQALERLKGEDPRMVYNAHCAKRVMNKDINLLIYGETGTGKEAFARAIHQASERADKPFVAVNCAAIPDNLIESELFGYKHGAFTGARREGRRGKILQANGGTLFLDEIGDMPLSLQTRLLRVLEDKEVLPLGSETPIPVQMHVISATHQDLQNRVNHEAFREDLFYRLNGLILELPPLRERTDRGQLIDYLLKAESAGQPITLDKAARTALDAYPWPGNIRQLRNVLRTAVALCEAQTIRLADLSPVIAQPAAKSPATPANPGIAHPAPAGPPANILNYAEKQALLRALELLQWNITETAAHLGMSRNTLYRKMRKHGIALPTLFERS
jgi:transcriptional regulator of acetoin/glycerol metabolism